MCKYKVTGFYYDNDNDKVFFQKIFYSLDDCIWFIRGNCSDCESITVSCLGGSENEYV